MRSADGRGGNDPHTQRPTHTHTARPASRLCALTHNTPVLERAIEAVVRSFYGNDPHINPATPASRLCALPNNTLVLERAIEAAVRSVYGWGGSAEESGRFSPARRKPAPTLRLGLSRVMR